jgi:phage/plasmid-associated DNA primase
MNLKECLFSLELMPVATINDMNKAYKRLMLLWHPDKYRSDEKLRLLAEQKTKEINIARDCLVAHFKGVKKSNGQQPETMRFSVNFNQVFTFISEFCTYSSSKSTEQLDLYMAYRDWCLENHLCPISIEDFESALSKFGFSQIKVISGITETVRWTGIELPGYWYFMNNLDNYFMPYAADLDQNFIEPKEYSDTEDDDDLSEVAF